MKVGGASWRKAIPLIVLVLLVASLPHVQADPDIETLWCTSYVDSRLGWTRTGGSPYLGDTDANYISTKTDAQTEGDFGFADLSSAGSITSVTLYLECYADDAPSDDSFDVWVYDGSSWTDEGNIAPSTLAWGTYETLDLSTKLNTDVKVDNAQVYFVYSKSKGADEVWIRRAYLYVDYTPTPAGQEYIRDVSQTLSFASNTVTILNQLIKRSVTLGVTLISNAARSWNLLRDLSQSISLAADSGRLVDFSRGVSQGISLVSDAWGSILTLIERTVSLSIDTSFSTNRVVSFIRAVSQAISNQMIGGGLLNPESPPDNGNINGVNPSALYVVNEFNTPMIMLNVLTVLATGAYLFMGRDFAWGAVATFLWFITALAMLTKDPNNWIAARVYSAFGTIFVALTLVSVIRRLNPEDQYFDEWE